MVERIEKNGSLFIIGYEDDGLDEIRTEIIVPEGEEFVEEKSDEKE